jgi:hypothetical protein
MLQGQDQKALFQTKHSVKCCTTMVHAGRKKAGNCNTLTAAVMLSEKMTLTPGGLLDEAVQDCQGTGKVKICHSTVAASQQGVLCEALASAWI